MTFIYHMKSQPTSDISRLKSSSGHVPTAVCKIPE